MPKPNPANPHDQYFRLSFGDPMVAANLINHYLPHEVSETLDLSRLRRLDGSFIEPGLRSQQSDLLFSASLRGGREAHVYLLFEHKSRPDPWVALQLLRYCLRIWERDHREIPGGGLRPIVPLVVYNGAAGWRAKRFGELFDGPESLRPFWPDFDFHMLDLAAQPEDRIVGDVHARVPLLAMRAIRQPNLGQQLPRIAALLSELLEMSTVTGMLYALLAYAVQAGDDISEQDIRRTELAALPDTGEAAMTTLAEKWLAEGREEGLTHGLLAGLRALITVRFGTAGLALMPEIEAISDPDRLQLLLNRIPDMNDVAELRALLDR